MNNNTPHPSVWDQNYRATADFKYGEQPNAFLVAQAARLAPATRILADGGISINAVLQREADDVAGTDAGAGEPTPDQTDLVILTHEAREGAMNTALAQLQALPSVLAPIVRIRKEELA